MGDDHTKPGSAEAQGAVYVPTNATFLHELQQALMSDVNIALEPEQLRKATSEGWLAANGGPYPKDSVPSTLQPKNYRFLCYRWIAFWLYEKVAAGGEQTLPHRLTMPATRSVLHSRWPDS